jgi:hypothetical protein
MLHLAIDTHLITAHFALPLLPHFVISETPRSSGAPVAALASDPDNSRWNGQSLSSGGLAKEYGFTDLNGSRPDAWRYITEVERAGKPADATGYRRSRRGRHHLIAAIATFVDFADLDLIDMPHIALKDW